MKEQKHEVNTNMTSDSSNPISAAAPSRNSRWRWIWDHKSTTLVKFGRELHIYIQAYVIQVVSNRHHIKNV